MAALEIWLDSVEKGNPALRAAREAFEAAGHEVDKQRAGHLPTLDLVATYGKNSQATGGFPGQAGYDIKQNAIGLQLNVPIFSGGTQSAKVDEAVAMKEKTRQDMEAARRVARFAAQQAWLGWQGAAARAQAGMQGVRAALAALQVARRGLESGLKTDLDVLQAEQQLAAARRDLRKARYEQIVTQLKLKAAAGSATLQDVVAVDGLFDAVREERHEPPPRVPRDSVRPVLPDVEV
jgi:outer membrane protein